MQEAIGIDVSKDALDIHRRADDATIRLGNDTPGFRRLLNWIGPDETPLIVFEATGAYHRSLEKFLTAHDLPFVKVNPKQAWRFAQAIGKLACDVLGMSTDTLTLRLQERGYAEFPGVLQRYSAQGNASLRRLQWRAAEGGNVTAQIWLGKQWLGQRDYCTHRADRIGRSPLWPAQTAFSAEVMRVTRGASTTTRRSPDHDPAPTSGA